MTESPEQNDKNSSAGFDEFIAEESLKGRALLMVDAMLEENPNINSKEAFQQALKSLKENPEKFPEEITNGNPNHG